MKAIDLNKLLRFSADMICTINRQGIFVTVSAASADILGYRPEELSGRYYQEFIHPNEQAAASAAIDEAIALGKSVQLQNRYLHRDGRVIPLDWTARWDAGEELLYCIARNGQLTRHADALRLSLEESVKRYKYVTKATSDAIWDWNLENGTLYWGEGFQTIFGYDPALVPPGIESWTAHIHPEDKTAVAGSIHTVLEGTETNWKAEYRYQKADGSFADVVDRGFVIRDSSAKAVRMVGAIHDISERKKGLADLQRITEDLSRQNGELQQFAYIVSHNLRSPVANIMGIANLMEMDRDDPETIDRCTSDLKTSIGRLNEVISDLSQILSFSAPAAKLPKEEVDLAAIMEDIGTDLGDVIRENQARITGPDPGMRVHTHKAYLYSIFHNLVNNALKYRSEKPPLIGISARADQDHVYIRISDNGQGIDLERYRDELFKPYKRFHGGSDGKGLGLFLVKSHVESLGGTIDIESAPGAGTCFTISLPLRDHD
jgi:PAS domain S-box-containing protein